MTHGPLDYLAKAAAIWTTLTASDKRRLRFGLFPAAPMEQAARDGFTTGTALALALLRCADDEARATRRMAPLDDPDAEDRG